MAQDFHLAEFGNGGDLVLLGNDLTLTEELLQMAYLALFGGNVEASTRGTEIPGQQREDWWANALIYPQASGRQFNSLTERALNTTVLNSAGRLEIQRAVEKDLQFMSDFAEVGVEVSIETYNRVEIRIRIKALGTQEEKTHHLLFDQAKNEVIIDKEL